MSDIESLNIQISATTKKATDSINYLIQKLSKLNGVLNSYSNSGAYMQGLKNLALGVTDLSKAVDNANVNRIKELASAMSTLANKGASLSKINASQFGGIARGLQSLKGLRITGEQFAGVQILSSSIGKLSGSNIEKAATSIPNLAQGLRQLSGIKIPSYGDALTNLYNGLSLLGRKSIVKAQDVGKIAEGLRAFETINIDSEKAESISQFARSIATLGYKSMGQAIDNIPKLATAFTNLAVVLSTAPKVSNETIRLAEAMSQLALASRSAGTATQTSSNSVYSLRGALQSLIPTTKRATRSTFSLAAMFGKLYASYFLVIRAFRALGKSINISSSLAEVQNVVATTFGNMSDKLDEFAEKSMYDFGLAELSAKQYASRFQAMGSAMGITAKQIADTTDFLDTKLQGQKRITEGIEDSYADLGSTMADMSINLTKLVSDYASFFNMDYDDVAKDFESIFTGQTRPMRQYGIDLTNATLKEWALKNGLDANIKTMTSAEKTMLRYQYVMAQSGKVMNDYQITMNNWANVVRTIGQQFTKLGSIIGQGLINVFKPVLISFRNFMNTFIGLTQKALNAVGKLLGWQIEIEEVGVSMDDGMDDYADSIDDAAGAAKKLNAQLRSIDELNNLTTSKGSNTGDDLLGGLQTDGQKITGGGIKFQDYESDINSWYELGKRVADKIRDALDSIKWDKVFQGARDFGKNLADYMNGRIQPETFYAVGRTIANALNTAIEFAYSFGDTFSFENLGTSIAEGINGFFKNFKFAKLAKTINKWVDGLKTTIKNILKKVKWDQVFEGLWDFFSNLSFDTYFVTGLLNLNKITAVARSLPAIFGAVKTAFSGIGDKIRLAAIAYDDFYTAGMGKTKALNAGINSLTSGLSNTQKALIGVGSAVGELALVYDSTKKLAKGTEDASLAIGEMFSGIVVGAAGLTSVLGFPYGLIATAILGLSGAVAGLITGLIEFEEEIQSASLANSIKSAFSDDSGVPIDKYIEVVTERILGLSYGFDEISSRSNSLNTAKRNVSDVALEIQILQDRMESATEVTAEDVEKLNGLFDELATAMQTKLHAASTVLYATFSENGPIAQFYDGAATAAENATNYIVENTDTTTKRLAELKTELETYDYGSEEWYEAYNEMMNLCAGINEVSQAMLDMDAEVQNTGLSLQKYFGGDEVDVSGLNSALGTLFEAASKSEEALRNSVDAAKDAAAEIGDQETYKYLSEGLPTAIANMNQASAEEITKVTDLVQKELIEGLDKVIEDSKDEWSTKAWWEKLMYNNDQEVYTGQQIMGYVENIIAPVEKELNSQFSELGIEASDWLSDEMTSMLKNGFNIDTDEIGSLFTENGVSELFGGYLEKFGTNIAGGISESVQEELNNMKPNLIDGGHEIVGGTLEGVESVPYREYLNAVKPVKENTIEAFCQQFGIHSPAREMYPVGKNVVLGVYEGFYEVDFAQLLSEWWDNSVQPFFDLERWAEIGQSAYDGLMPKIETLCNALTGSFQAMSTTVSSIWEDMVMAINSALEGLKVPSFELKGKFDLEKGSVPSIDVKYFAQGGFPETGSLFFAGEAGTELLGTMNGRNTVASSGEITGISDTIRSTSAEEIQLLRQQNTLLQGILQKEFGISKNEVFKSVRSSAVEYQRMTGNPAFS